jgi:redox-sensitive bicupin YhaK (pirin superfamily)
MKIVQHPSNSRGHADHGWLKSYHSFSFGDYINPAKTRFGLLRVINEDRVAPSMGFDTHGHANMEIISIPLSGRLHHRDSNGNDFFLESGDVQVMSAGNGIQHSEYNASDSEETHFLQIWVFPNQKDGSPSYQQKHFDHFTKPNNWELLVSPSGEKGSLRILQNSHFLVANFSEGQNSNYALRDPNHGVYAFMIEGEASVAGQNLKGGDAVGIHEATEIPVEFRKDSKLLLIEIPMNV